MSGAELHDDVTRLRALADETRLGVVRLLLRGPQHVGNLHRTLRVEQSLMSHHLRVLRQAGLVRSERRGKRVRYHLAAGVGSGDGEPGIDLGRCRIVFDEQGRGHVDRPVDVT